jgi:P4 family phage/plasmid primase-like protien
LDDKDEYNKLIQHIPTHDIMYLRPLDNILSKFIYRLYGDKFVCSNPEKNEWFHFNGTRWIKENKNYNLRKLLINDVFRLIDAYRKKLIKSPNNVDEELISNYQQIIKIISSGNKLNSLEIEFYDDKFTKNLDGNPDLIGFNNGVYNLKTHEFLPGDPSFYVSFTVGYDYKPFDKHDPIIHEIWNLLTKILPLKAEREYMMKALASCLDGHIRDENFYILSGKNASGGNGKSILTELMLKTLGDYGQMGRTTLLTSKREDPNSTNSALASIKGKRLVLYQEIEATAKIQVGTMKTLTGGDSISTRELFGTEFTFQPQAKHMMIVNKVPGISSDDGGVRRRIKIIEFISRFVTNAKSDNPFEFEKDDSLKNKLADYRQYFMGLLLQYYNIYINERLLEPESVMRVTTQYLNDNNVIYEFVSENLVVEPKGRISLSELQTLFDDNESIRHYFKKFILFRRQLECHLEKCFITHKNGTRTLSGYIWKKNKEDEKELENFVPVYEQDLKSKQIEYDLPPFLG